MSRVLLVAFSCCPGMGSEAGIGWNFAIGLCRRHDITLLTTDEFRPQIDAYLRDHPGTPLRVVYQNGALPRSVMFKSYSSANIYYYTWQLCAALRARRLHRRHNFDLVHHVNWGRYWMAAGAAFAGAPFVWGPIGAAEGAASPMLRGMSFRGRWSERLRDCMRWIFEHDPLTAITARRARVAIAATHETADKLRRWGVRNIEVIPSVGIAADDLPDPSIAQACAAADRFDYECASIGRLLDWKGFHLGLRAFAATGLAGRGARYAIIGEGPEEARLRRLAADLGIAGSVDFLGQMPRKQCLEILARSRMLVHPSFHDSGGFVLVEAMALGRPVVCLDIGGPAVIVDDQSGIRIRPADSEDAVQQIAQSMLRLGNDPMTYARLSRGALSRGHGEFLWSRKMDQIDAIYASILSIRSPLAFSPIDGSVSPSFATMSTNSLRITSTEKSEKIVA